MGIVQKTLVVDGIWGITLPNFRGIMINHYKDPHKMSRVGFGCNFAHVDVSPRCALVDFPVSRWVCWRVAEVVESNTLA